jgi:hypothetical protein
MTGELLAAALGYAQRGWPVFPCAAGSKVPAIPAAHPPGSICKGECGREGHGFHDATTSPERIRGWWRRYPNANIGIATGQPGPDVLDVDVKAGVNGYAALNRLRRAGLLTGGGLLVRTPSNGIHVYFAGSSQGCGRLPEHGLDFKARGGYVLAPPSVIGATGYDLIEERDLRVSHNWAADRLLLRPAPRPMPGRQATRGRPGIERLATWVAALPEGNRNSGLYWAACRAAETGADPELLIAASTLPEDEARRTVGSAARRAAE